MSRSNAVRRGRHALLARLARLGRARLRPGSPPPPADAATGDAPPPVATEAATSQGARTYTPADFARFAPRNALDMLNNVPGFAIDEGDTERRGLGQATGNVLINGERFSGKSTDIFTELRPDQRRQRRPDRDRRRRHPQHFRPDRPGRQRRHRRRAAFPAISSGGRRSAPGGRRRGCSTARSRSTASLGPAPNIR